MCNFREKLYKIILLLKKSKKYVSQTSFLLDFFFRLAKKSNFRQISTHVLHIVSVICCNFSLNALFCPTFLLHCTPQPARTPCPTFLLHCTPRPARTPCPTFLLPCPRLRWRQSSHAVCRAPRLRCRAPVVTRAPVLAHTSPSRAPCSALASS